jgi:hypothetical protein
VSFAAISAEFITKRPFIQREVRQMIHCPNG